MRLTALVALLGLAACANMGAPPGGPPRLIPPAVLMTSPDSGAVLATYTGDAVIQFDEVIDEMAGGGGGGGGGGGAVGGLAKQILLSPVAGDVSVSWHRSSIHVKPKEGWKPGRVYRLQLLPGIIDLHRNVLKHGKTIIFSTGPAIPTASLQGIALAWVEQRALPAGLIRAVLKPDTVAYLAMTDSTGRFRLDGVPPGQYVVYAVNDQNSNRRLDGREAYDSVTVSLDTAAHVALWTFVHDTIGPRLRASDPIDSLSFRLNFSAPLAVTGLPDTSRVHLFQLPDTVPVGVTAVLLPAANDSLVARLRAALDSARRAADTTHAAPPPADTTIRKTPVKPARDTTARRPVAPVAHPGGGPGGPQAVDSVVIKLLATRPVPTDRLVVRTAQPLQPGTKYFVRVSGATNMNGVSADAVGVITIPVPKKQPADSAKAKPAPAPPKPKP